jgi:hypothetical protein
VGQRPNKGYHRTGVWVRNRSDAPLRPWGSSRAGNGIRSPGETGEWLTRWHSVPVGHHGYQRGASYPLGFPPSLWTCRPLVYFALKGSCSVNNVWTSELKSLLEIVGRADPCPPSFVSGKSPKAQVGKGDLLCVLPRAVGASRV